MLTGHIDLIQHKRILPARWFISIPFLLPRYAQILLPAYRPPDDDGYTARNRESVPRKWQLPLARLLDRPRSLRPLQWLQALKQSMLWQCRPVPDKDVPDLVWIT